MLSKNISYKKLIREMLIGVLSIAGGVSVGAYLENTYITKSASSFIIVLFSGLLFCVWKKIPVNESRRYYVLNTIYAIGFSFFMVYGQSLDYCSFDGFKEMLLMGTGMSAAIIPIVMLISELTRQVLDHEIVKNRKYLRNTFIAVAFAWLLGYMAAFPGIYAVDAMTWYLEFSDPSFPVSSQWSPVYAGLFYLFVETGKNLLGSFGAGLAVFMAIQTGFLLYIVWRILIYVFDLGGNRAVIVTGAFFALIPTHIIMAVQTVQGAPFMGCFAMIIMHLCKAVANPEEYWSNRRNMAAFIMWNIAACILRNNAYYALLLFLLFVPFYTKGSRLKLLASLLVILVAANVYKGPLLDMFGVTKGTALREMMSMPLQQMACVYTEHTDEITDEQRKELERYVNREVLQTYEMYPSISDTIKANLDVDFVQDDLLRFAKLYLMMGVEAPEGYIKAAYMQNLGLCFIDKAYPDPRMWHPYLNYASYKHPNGEYINIERHSLFPLYDKILGKLFGYAEFRYGGDVETVFTSVPILSVFCRASTYFWLVLYLAIAVIIKRKTENIIPIGLILCFTFTIIIGPVIMYRYYAPVIFSMPVLLSHLLNSAAVESKGSI